MKIAEQIAPDGATTGSQFNQKVAEIIVSRKLRRVIETGTQFGTGSTRAILSGLKKLGGKYRFITIEVNPQFHKQAMSNNLKEVNVEFWNGLSVSHSQKPVDITFNVPDFVVVDHLPQNRTKLYMREVNFNVPDNLLDHALQEFYYEPDLVLLDSAGHMGLIEFKYLMERAKSSYILALDDTDHGKHYESLEFIRANPKRFEILWNVRGVTYPGTCEKEKFGSAIILVK